MPFGHDGKAPDIAHATHLWVPSYLKRAKQTIRVVFYVHADSRRIVVGAPEQFDAPNGYIKVVCQNAREVEQMSQKMREQDRRDEEMTEEEREAIEGPLRRHARQELTHRMMNSTNQINRDFCRFVLQKLDEDENRRKMRRVSFMHQEAFEDGK